MKRLQTLLVAGAFALSSASLAPAALAADPHHHGHGTEAAKLQLDHGKKWATDAALRRGMEAIRDTVNDAAPPVHKGTAKPAAYAELGKRVEIEVGRIVAECKLPPAADEQLHIVVADLVAGTDAMKAAKSGAEGRKGLLQVAGTLATYDKYFDHPGWKAKRP